MFFLAVCRLAQAANPTTEPADASIDPVPILIRQLADPDPTVRTEAFDRLKEIGKPALEPLRRAAALPDPELSGRAREIIRRIERRPIPGSPPDRDPNHTTHSMRISVQNGQATVDVEENGRKIHIAKHPAGQIEVSVTGHLDGREATETWKADTPEELQREDPEVFALFEKYGGGAGPGFRLGGQGGQVNIQGNIVIGGGAAAPDPLLKLQQRITPNLLRLPPADQRDILLLLHQARIARLKGKPADADRLAGQLREKLLAHNLDPGDELPAPAKPATRPAEQ